MTGSIEALKTNKTRCVPILTPDRIDSKPKLDGRDKESLSCMDNYIGM